MASVASKGQPKAEMSSKVLQSSTSSGKDQDSMRKGATTSQFSASGKSGMMQASGRSIKLDAKPTDNWDIEKELSQN